MMRKQKLKKGGNMNKNEYLLIVFNTIVEFYRSVVEKHEEEKKNFIVFLDSPMMHGDGAWYAIVF